MIKNAGGPGERSGEWWGGIALYKIYIGMWDAKEHDFD